MIENDQILAELQKINHNLEKVHSRSTFGHVSLSNFFAGLFHSFGNLVGTVIIFFGLIFIASRFNITRSITEYFEKMMTQINWSKIIPPTKVEIDPNIF